MKHNLLACVVYWTMRGLIWAGIVATVGFIGFEMYEVTQHLPLPPQIGFGLFCGVFGWVLSGCLSFGYGISKLIDLYLWAQYHC